MLVACFGHACGIFTIIFMMACSPCPASVCALFRLLDALTLRGGVWIVFLPIVDLAVSRPTLKKTNLDKRRNQRAWLAIPVRLFLNVVIGQAG